MVTRICTSWVHSHSSIFQNAYFLIGRDPAKSCNGTRQSLDENRQNILPREDRSIRQEQVCNNIKYLFMWTKNTFLATRYNSITRFNSDLSRNSRPRRKSSEIQHYQLHHRKSESASSSSSVSPASPPMCLPTLSGSSFQAIPENNEAPYHFDTFSWSSSSSVTSEDMSPSYRSSPVNYDYVQDNNNNSTSSAPNSIEPTYQSFDISMNHNLSYTQSPTTPGLHPNGLYKSFTNHNHIQDQTYPGYSQFPMIHGSNDDSADQFAIFGGLSQTSIDSSSVIGMHCNWDPTLSSSMTGTKPPSSNYTVRNISWTLTRRGRMLTWLSSFFFVFPVFPVCILRYPFRVVHIYLSCVELCPLGDKPFLRFYPFNFSKKSLCTTT